jgi:HEPN domain-containing protein
VASPIRRTGTAECSMKRPEDEIRRLVSEWLRKADLDFRTVDRLCSEDPFRDIVAFHAQQAAEKYLKALLTRHQVEFPKTHDLRRLLDLLAEVEPQLAASLTAITWLEPFGVDVRYRCSVSRRPRGYAARRRKARPRTRADGQGRGNGGARSISRRLTSQSCAVRACSYGSSKRRSSIRAGRWKVMVLSMRRAALCRSRLCAGWRANEFHHWG